MGGEQWQWMDQAVDRAQRGIGCWDVDRHDHAPGRASSEPNTDKVTGDHVEPIGDEIGEGHRWASQP